MTYNQSEINHSFSILAYKESQYLDDCIRSLLNQFLSNSIIFIATSTDNSLIRELSEKYSIPVYINTSSTGIASDWSFAYQCAKTRYVTLAHQDDIYLPDYTHECLKAAERYPDNLITSTDYFEIFNQKYKVSTPNLMIKFLMLRPFYLFSQGLSALALKKMMIMLGSPICCPSVMYNKENIGNYNFDPSFKINLDWNAWINFAKRKGAFIYLNKRLIAHRIHPDSETCRGIDDNTRHKEDLYMFKKLWPHFLVKLIFRIYSLSYITNKTTG
jgi:glycosyltransferase involved in cell wall biosynthesis